MNSLIEYIINERGDEEESRFRAGGPGSREQEKARHSIEVGRLRQRYNRRKQRGFRSDQEERQERQRHSLAKKGEQKRHDRSYRGRHVRH